MASQLQSNNIGTYELDNIRHHSEMVAEIRSLREEISSLQAELESLCGAKRDGVTSNFGEVRGKLNRILSGEKIPGDITTYLEPRKVIDEFCVICNNGHFSNEIASKYEISAAKAVEYFTTKPLKKWGVHQL